MAEYQTRLQQVKDKLIGEQETRTMLDENLRVLTRRINDLEIDNFEDALIGFILSSEFNT